MPTEKLLDISELDIFALDPKLTLAEIGGNTCIRYLIFDE